MKYLNNSLKTNNCSTATCCTNTKAPKNKTSNWTNWIKSWIQLPTLSWRINSKRKSEKWINHWLTWESSLTAKAPRSRKLPWTTTRWSKPIKVWGMLARLWKRSSWRSRVSWTMIRICKSSSRPLFSFAPNICIRIPITFQLKTKSCFRPFSVTISSLRTKCATKSWLKKNW